jgi:2-methylcitrate dehydratase PrpD
MERTFHIVKWRVAMAPGPESATEALAAVVEACHYSDLGPVTRSRVREHVKDCLGVALAGSRTEPGRIVLGLVGDYAADGGVHVIGSGIATNPWEAAWANGTLSHLLDFDDNGFSHPTACILPAALAAAELADADGQDFMVAMVAGWEVFERLSRSVRAFERVARKGGVHPTGIYGCPAAAAAASKLLGLSREQTAMALGLASSSSGGLTEQFGTWGKGMQAGNAARAGVMAALLVQRGYWGAQTVIEGKHGLLSAFFGAGNYDLSLISEQGGDTWAIEKPGLNIKRFPACGGTQRGIAAALELRRQVVSDPADIERIEVTGSESLFHSLHIDTPTRGFEGKFSLRFCLAAAFADGEVTIDTFTDQTLQRPEIQALMKKIHTNVVPGGFEPGVRRYTTPVTVHVKGGASASTVMDTPPGNVANRLSYEQITEKFRKCAARALPSDRTESLNEAIDNLDSGKVRELLTHMTEAGQ